MLAALLLAGLAHGAAIDLHVHLRMDKSLPGFFRKPGRSRLDNQVSLDELKAGDVRLVMATLYTPLGGTKALLEQVDAVEQWAKEHDAAMVRTPEEAEAVLRSKPWKLGLILAAEGGHGLDTPESMDKLWDRGLRMITLVHFHDNKWGGAAKVRYWPKPSCVPGGKDARRNDKGLESPALTDHAVAKGFLLDLTHASDKLAFDVAGRYPDLPLIFSHEAARELTDCERALSPALLAEVKRSGGMVGVTFARQYVDGKLLEHAKALAAGGSLAFGSDYNGLITPVTDYPSALKAGVPAGRSAEAFVELWRKASAARSRTRRP